MVVLELASQFHQLSLASNKAGNLSRVELANPKYLLLVCLSSWNKQTRYLINTSKQDEKWNVGAKLISIPFCIFLRSEDINQGLIDPQHNIVLLMVATTQNNGKCSRAFWQMDENYWRISTHTSFYHSIFPVSFLLKPFWRKSSSNMILPVDEYEYHKYQQCLAWKYERY